MQQLQEIKRKELIQIRPKLAIANTTHINENDDLIYEYGDKFSIADVDYKKKVYFAELLDCFSDEEQISIPFNHPHFLILYTKTNSSKEEEEM